MLVAEVSGRRGEDIVESRDEIPRGEKSLLVRQTHGGWSAKDNDLLFDT